MGVIWSKVWFDIWRHKTRTMLVVASIAIGVFAVGATFGQNDLMMPAMDSSHATTIPSHLTMYVNKPVDRDVIDALLKVPGVEGIEPVNIVNMRYKKFPEDTWHRGNILMREDFANQSFDLLQLREGEWPEGDNLSIERMHSPFYGLGIGDELILEIDNQERHFPITGLIRHPFVPPPSMYDLAWFFSGPDIMERFGIPQGKFIELLVRVTPYSDEHAREVATVIKDQLAKQNIAVTATVYQDPAKHWGRPFIDGLGIVTEILSIVSLFLSVVLVLNTMTSIITQQTNQIGILKAIGSTRDTIIRIYLTGVFFYGLLAVFISLPLGVISAYGISRWFLGLFNIDFEIFSFSTKAVALQIFAALVVPLIAALLPIFHGASISVREAIASYGLGSDFNSTRIDQAIERIGSKILATHYLTALVNTFRRKGRLVLTELVLVISGIMFLMVMSLSSSIQASLDEEFTRRTHDMVIGFTDPQRIERAVSLAESVKGVEKADMWVVYPTTILVNDKKARDAGVGSQIQGVPLEDPMFTPMITEGRWLLPGDGRAIVMSAETAEDEGIKVGDTITLDMRDLGKSDWEVVGMYRVLLMFSGGFSIDAIYAPREAVLEAAKKVGRTETLLVRTSKHDDASTKAIANELESLFKDKNMSVVGIETLTETRKTADSSFSMTVSMLLMLALIIGLVGAIGLAGSLSISVIERTKEIGVLRAIGARSGTIMRMFVMEGIVQGILSWIIAVPLSLFLAPLLSNALGQAMFNTSLVFGYNYPAILIWFGTILVISTLAALLPAQSATRVNVRHSLAYE